MRPTCSTSREVMIEEATRARTAIHAEVAAMMAIRTAPQGWLRDKAASLAFYNDLLTRLGATPAAA